MQALVGIPRDHVLQLGDYVALAPKLFKHAQALPEKLEVVYLLQAIVDCSQGRIPVSISDQVVDQDLARNCQCWITGQQSTRAIDRSSGLCAVFCEQSTTVIETYAQREKQRIGRSKPFGNREMTRRFIPIAKLCCQAGQRTTTGKMLGVLFDQTEVLCIGFFEMASTLLRFGIGKLRASMRLVEFEDVSELDKRSVDIPFFQKGQPFLKMLFSPLFGRVASCEIKGQCHHRPEGHHALEHIRFPVSSFVSGVVPFLTAPSV
ncbi:hypothetical protein XM53_14450 [Roseovarius atlanticus]|uniref:Uncharacterized protein n=1 Tax=Roseovarius atlanticus TaxID=1641875 RepID=A0A0T5NST2_9RHOB|nr:hypothetical protein XM53_14450 [Roseovarius atlanticus]